MPRKKKAPATTSQATEPQEPVDGAIEILESSYTDTPLQEPEPRPDYEVLI